MSSPPLPSSARRVPPPCWTQAETLALIEAYRDKWYSVNRANLRAADWDAVAASVADSASGLPPKSSVQCRHKIEKLRKRYRTEKQRCLSFPGRFSSSWDLFPLLDAMSFGSVGSKQSQDVDEIGEGPKFQKPVVGPKKFSDVNRDFDPVFNVGLDPDLAFRARKVSRGIGESQGNTARVLGNGFCAKPVSDVNSVSVAFKPNDYGRFDGNCVYESGVPIQIAKTLGINKSLMPHVTKLKGYGNIAYDSRTNNDHVFEDYGDCAGFPLGSLGDLPPGYRAKCQRTDSKSNPSFVSDVRKGIDNRYRLGESVADCWRSPPVSRVKGYGKVGLDSDVPNGIDDGLKKLKDPIEELVSAITMSTNTFVKVEKMKMEMAMEVEKMRMDMCLKHNQMILESQQQIVEAFAKAASEKSRKKRKLSGDGDSDSAARSCPNNSGEE